MRAGVIWEVRVKQAEAHLTPRVWSRLPPKVDVLAMGGADLRALEAVRQVEARQRGRR